MPVLLIYMFIVLTYFFFIKIEFYDNCTFVLHVVYQPQKGAPAHWAAAMLYSVYTFCLFSHICKSRTVDCIYIFILLI